MMRTLNERGNDFKAGLYKDQLLLIPSLLILMLSTFTGFFEQIKYAKYILPVLSLVFFFRLKEESFI
ncbi:hypothetical protein [Endozoicomonas sp. YOMI1]|uniref:hypothetical protein n=1 Tax=Endozoicomonas sp. YOMI1 TaxID=2828739 RepID=UPI0021482D70|nr:hypothetical protein [Endozoicomonas sp. YOMI1]